MQGTPGSGAFFKSVACTIAAGIISIPSIALPSTTDGLDVQTARYTAVFFDSKGIKRDNFFPNEFALTNTLPTPVSWAQIRISAGASQPLRDTSVYTKTEVNNQIQLATQALINEIPSGLINGSNQSFLTSRTPVLGSEIVFADGNILTKGSGLLGYTISGNTIAINFAPLDSVFVSYRTSSGLINNGIIPMQIQLGDGTIATLASIPDGKYFKRSGSSIIGGSPVENGDPRVPVTTPVLYLDNFPGADLGLKLTAALAALPTGGVIDCRMFTGAQSLSASVTINKPYTRILFGNINLSMGAFQFIVPVGVHGVELIGQTVSFLQADTTGTNFVYSGTGNTSAILIGDTTAQTFYPRLEDIKINCTTSTGAGLLAVNTVRGVFDRLHVLSPVSGSTVAGITLQGGAGTGTTYSGGNVIRDPHVNGFRYGVFFGGVGAFSCNANRIEGGFVAGLNAAGSYGVYFGNGDSNIIFATDLENWDTAVLVGAGTRTCSAFGVRIEGILTYYFDVEATATGSYLHYLAPTGSTNRDLGTRTTIIDPYTPANSRIVLGELASSSGTRSLIVSPQLLVLNTVDPPGEVSVNQSANTGTGGLKVYSGGVSPTLAAHIAASGILAVKAGAALTIAANAITVTNSTHEVGGAGPLRTINGPPVLTTGTGTIALIPTGTWAYDNAGNILGSGTAVVGRTMFATFNQGTGKYSMSY